MTTILHQIVVDMVTRGGPGGAGSAGGGGATSHGGAIANEVKHAESSISRMGETLKSTLGGMADAFTGAVEKVGRLTAGLGMAAGAAGIGAITYGVVHLNKELESTNISLASIFQAQGFAPTFTSAMTMATDQVAKMKQDIKTLPGDLGNLTNTMSQLASPAGLAGANADQIRQLAGKTMLASSILLGSRFGTQQSLEVGTREMAMILAGHAGGRNDLANVLPGVAGHQREFSGMTPEQRLKAVNKALDALTKDSAGVFATSWTAVYTTLLDNFKYKLLAPATSPLFEHIKADIIKVNDWFSANEQRVSRFAQVLGDGLANAWDRGIALAMKWGPMIVQFGKDLAHELTIVWDKLGPALKDAGDALSHAIGDGTALKDIGRVLELYAVTKVAGGESKAGAALGATAGAAFGPAGSALGSQIGGLLGVGSMFGLPGVAVTKGTELGLIGAMKDKPQETVHAMTKLGQATQHLSDVFDTTFGPTLEEFAIRNVRLAASALDGLADVIHIVANPMASLRQGLDQFGDSIGITGVALRGMVQWLEDHHLIAKVMSNDDPLESPDRSQILTGFARTMGNTILSQNAEDVRKHAPKLPPGFGQIRIGHIEVNVSSNADPSRVARLTVDRIIQVARHPKSDPFTANYSASR